MSYFAAEKTKDIAGKLMAKVQSWYDRQRTSGRYEKIQKSWAYQNGLTVNSTGAISWQMTRGGEQGEIVHVFDNQFRSFGNQLVNITTAERPSVTCGGANSDYRSIAQAHLGNGIAENLLTERGLEEMLKRCCKSAVYSGEGFILSEWDVHAGKPHSVSEDGQRVVNTGEPKRWLLGSMDVPRDDYAESFDALTWFIARVMQNKYEVAAAYPELAEEIEALGPDKDLCVGLRMDDVREDDTDLIPVWKFFHDRNSAMPEGRVVTFLSDSILLFDGPNPYQRKPISKIFPDEISGTPYGNTVMFDLLSDQDALNAIDTIVLTMEVGRGYGNILVPNAANISNTALGGFLNVIGFDGQQKPEPLVMPQIPAELFEKRREIVVGMETKSGINSVIRGNPNANVGADASGVKANLIAQTAMTSNSGLQSSYANCTRDVIHNEIQLYHDFGGDVPRLAKMAGKNKQYLVKEFTSKDLEGIDRVTVDLGNPVMRTPGGRMTVVEWLVQQGVIGPGDLKKAIELIRTGQLETTLEAPESQLMRIRGENERLMEGEPVRALMSDPHWLEIPEHLTLGDNPSMRDGSPESESVMEIMLAHVSEHLDMWRNMDPALIAVRGGQPAPMPLPPPMPGMPPGAPMPPDGSQTPPPQAGSPSSTGAPASMNPNGAKPQQPGMPGMPKDLNTGQAASLPGGNL